MCWFRNYCKETTLNALNYLLKDTNVDKKHKFYIFRWLIIIRKIIIELESNTFGTFVTRYKHYNNKCSPTLKYNRSNKSLWIRLKDSFV